MFENYTLKDQRKLEEARGWKSTYAALTYCTAEAVIYRNPGGVKSFWDLEILQTRRISGGTDCLGKDQIKYGTYVKPTDQSARHAIIRGIKELFDWDLLPKDVMFADTVGPWLYRARISRKNWRVTLSVTDEQAELTPFQASLFVADVTGFELTENGCHLAVTKDAMWVKLGDFVDKRGSDTDWIHATMLFLAIEVLGKRRAYGPFQEFRPGEEYHLTLL